MPFWSDEKTENYKAKLEHKMCIAKETPESTFDISDCKLSDIPPGVYSMCRVFRKESLNLENNQLTNLQNGGFLKDLGELLIFNIKNNKLYSLPDEIKYLTQLQEFHLENNRLKKLPPSFEKLVNLRYLNLKNNNLQNFPLCICSLLNLEFLDICNNPKIKILPKELCKLVRLKTLNLDAEKFSYPSSDTCFEGLESVMKFLCKESGLEYSQNIYPSDALHTMKTDSSNYKPVESPDSSASYHQYQRAKEQRQKELLLMEEALKESFTVQSSEDTSQRRKQLLVDIAQEQERMENEILLLQKKKEKEKNNLLTILSNVENHSAKLIDTLMKLNDRRKKLEDMAAVLEKDRVDNEELFTIKQEELDQLRRKEILEAMTEMLLCEEKFGKYEARKYSIAEELQNDENESNLRLQNIFQEKELDQQILINKLQEEERYQKEAFEVLQQQKDRQHQEIAHQIRLIEKELSNLTVAEMKKKNLKINSDLNVLADHRIALACLLTELLSARERRENELKEILQKMEIKHAHEMEDFWLIQYQKLLDKKPKGIVTAELGMDQDVKYILLDIPATDLLPLFASKEITFEDLLKFTVKDLKMVGVLDEDICEVILQKAHNYSKLRKYSIPQFPDAPEPSAPPEPFEFITSDTEQPFDSSISEFSDLFSPDILTPSAPPFSPDTETKLWCQTECVICLDMQTSAVFLPCGHVCCCQNCSNHVEVCPMCRTTIASKFILSVS